MPDRSARERTEARRSARRRASRALPPLVAVLLALTACTAPPAEVPDDAVMSPGTSAPAVTIAPTGGLGAGGDELTQRITLCLARYGLGERPSPPDESASSEEQMAVQQQIDTYDATLTDCSAEALGTNRPSATPSS
ncbi:hypothetical protein GRS96_08150 [Rathayibacter sp. VKM Ac-2803]|uniref:hypothetical protein n=1 Tax=unclassified Rathayibacter TaxID=2609250 RepID=UPI00135793C2|nr:MULTISPECIES: hypothetical protein [unclassified Rathayibacter]MWV49247.1 hypothetical protein [Rathayibacter sp. VKM Ac-2803]MWV60003.1 hypothetical protein [Rathayibacter sp. VKM Ac-2754]